MRLDRPKPKTVVRTEWMRTWPKRSWNLRFWAEVGKRVKRGGVRHADLETIRNIAKEVEYEWK